MRVFPVKRVLSKKSYILFLVGGAVDDPVPAYNHTHINHNWRLNTNAMGGGNETAYCLNIAPY